MLSKGLRTSSAGSSSLVGSLVLDMSVKAFIWTEEGRAGAVYTSLWTTLVRGPWTWKAWDFAVPPCGGESCQGLQILSVYREWELQSHRLHPSGINSVWLCGYWWHWSSFQHEGHKVVPWPFTVAPGFSELQIWGHHPNVGGYTQGGSRGLWFKLSFFGIGRLVGLLVRHAVLLAGVLWHYVLSLWSGEGIFLCKSFSWAFERLIFC